MSICFEPQEGSIVQCSEMALHDVKADGEFEGHWMSLWCSCMKLYGSRWCTNPKCVVVVKTTIFTSLKRMSLLKSRLYSVLHTKLMKFSMN